jgi:hypothetical protein
VDGRRVTLSADFIRGAKFANPSASLRDLARTRLRELDRERAQREG